MSRMFHLTNHALCRMEIRNVSKYQVAKTVFGGQIYSTGNGLYKAKLREDHGRTTDEYIVVFSKQSNNIVTVEHNVFRSQKDNEEQIASSKIRRIYRLRKQAIIDQEFDSYCKEEYWQYNLCFSA